MLENANSAPPALEILTKPENQQITAIDLLDFLLLQFVPKAFLLGRWLHRGSLTVCYAGTGVGKTWWAVTVGLAVASARAFATWDEGKGHKVLYIDGEMGREDMQERFHALHNSGDWPIEPGMVKFLAYDTQDNPIPDLSTAQGQAVIEQNLDGVELLILDNLGALFPGSDDADAESWQLAKKWFLDLRRRKIAVLLLHHANKAGEFRGITQRFDSFDNIIKLVRPGDYRAEHGARFEMQFQKARGLRGFESETIELTLGQNSDDHSVWSHQTKLDDVDIIRPYFDQGLSRRQAAEACGISKNRACRAYDKLNGKHKGNGAAL